MLSLFGLLVFIADFGFEQNTLLQGFFNGYYFVVLTFGIFATLMKYVAREKSLSLKVLAFDTLSLLFIVGVILFHFYSKKSGGERPLFYDDNWLKFAILLTFIREVSAQNLNYTRLFLNPAQLFIASFFVVILLGSFLLLLPNASHSGISFLDALFTSASAVCVTGLIVVDTGSYFTLFGQAIICLLIQVGGLGILTFASYFSYFFRGGATYENQLVLSDITNSQKIGEVFSVLQRILAITFSIEIVGAAFIYFSVDRALFDTEFDHLFFSVFHAVSAFCNAGFSTLPNSLYESGFRYNYALQIVVICLFVLGGLGFPIVVNLLKYLKYLILGPILQLKSGKKQHRPWVLNLNSRITLITTLSLTLIGTVFFYFSEYDNTLAEHSGFGKIVTAWFGASTPRTAGFNTVDMSALHVSTLIIVFFLMWIGASPASTGGGIKTSTFAIAVLNFISIAKGKARIEVYRREIAAISVRRAFATIVLSLIVIGLGVFFLSISDREKDLLSIAFETVSAYSTVGLSVGITGSLSPMGKWVIIAIMFIGRVGMLSILIAIFKKVKHKNYQYPTEEILIN